ncbi:MAG TPA: carbohydrate ABC transporter permease [Candidatus Saccharimonadales bacterium]|nr:carbohydrate ABC transporter permease [Candidatus Saccharimonadales bacterium]
MTAIAASSTIARTASATRRRRFPNLPKHFVVIFLMFIWLIPTIGLFINSFRPAADVQASGWWTAIFQPSQATLDNYAYVLSQSGLGSAFINSLFISIPATIIPIFVAAFAAYAFAWMSFPGRNILFVIVVGLLVVPLQTTFIPVLELFANFGLNGQFLALWLAHTGYGLPFAVYLLRNFMGQLPREVFESAAIDGASPVASFFRLALPMSVPAIAALAIFQFLFVWNDLLVALIYLGAANPQNQPLTIVVANLVNSLGSGWWYLAAAAFISMALPLTVFLALQRYFIRGIVGGSVKG